MKNSTNIEVVKNQNESNANLIRRFTKRLQGSRVLALARKNRFRGRPESRQKRKEWRLRRIERQKERHRLWKLGKIK